MRGQLWLLPEETLGQKTPTKTISIQAGSKKQYSVTSRVEGKKIMKAFYNLLIYLE